MQSPIEERAWWDEHAGPLECWGDAATWDEGQAQCIDALRPVLDGKAGWAFDLGCGVGRLSVPILREYDQLKVMGFDVSSEMLAWAKRVQQERFRPVLCDGRSIPVPLHGNRDALGGCPYYVCGWSVLMFQHIPFDAVVTYLHEVREVLHDEAPFRFQFTVGEPHEQPDGTVPFAHFKHDVDAVLAACLEARLEVTAVDRGLVMEEWVWVTAVRR